MARPPLNPLTPPESRRGSLFIGTRTPSKHAAPQPDPIDIAQLSPEPGVSAQSVPAAPEPEASGTPVQRASVDAARSEAVAATEAMPWLFADPGTADRRPTPGVPLPIVPNAIAPGDDAEPAEAAQALSGLPFFDGSGAEHTPDAQPLLPRLSGKMHRIDFDVAGVLESVAARVRAGEIDVGTVDPGAGEAAALASVLAALLRQRAR
ncbi:MAG TPA: hypothetical protein VG432_09540 [Gemmatimonadaceae bacterium]|nr:hypothetical protein [Gemmatimonadaceae bacterium]